MNFPRFTIAAYPDFASVTPKAVVSYHAELVNPDQNALPKGTQFQWKCINDPATSPESSRAVVHGPRTRHWENAKWRYPGLHTLVLAVIRPDGKTDVYSRKQWVDTASNILGRECQPSDNESEPGPFQVLAHKEMEYKVLRDIERVMPPLPDKKEDHGKTMEALTSYIGHLKHNLDGLEGKESLTVFAMHIDRERSLRTRLRLYLVNTTGPNKKPAWTLVDWTNPMFKQTTGVYTGTGATHGEAVKNVINQWDQDNRYPDGIIRYEFKVPSHGVALDGEFDTDGKSFTDALTAWFDYVAIGSAVVAGVTTLVLPVPGSRVVSAAIWASMFTSTASATITLAQRHSEGFGNWKDDSFDGLSIAGNLFAGTATWKLGAKVTAATRMGTTTQAALIGQVGTDGLQGILLGEQYIADYQSIMDDQSLVPSERLSRIMELFRSAALAGALTYLAIKGTKADIDNLNNGTTRITKADMENPNTLIDLDENVAQVPLKRNQDTVETFVETEPGRNKTQVKDGKTVSAIKHMKGEESRFSRDLEDLVRQRADDIIAHKVTTGKKILGKKNAVATSRSGIEENDYISPPFENLGGTGQFKDGETTPGITRDEKTKTYFFESEEKITDYMNHVEKLYAKKLDELYAGQPKKTQLHPYMGELISDYIKKENPKGFIDRNGAPGLHAEIVAVNDVFNELSLRGINPKAYDLSKIEVATYLVKGMKTNGMPFERCDNCKGILGKRLLILTDPN